MASIAPMSPTKSIRPGSRDTGFPEPFNGTRNTTLPHPDADLSPNACISADDISVHKVMHRSRRSFLAKHKRTTSHGKILPEHEKMYSDSAVVLDSEGESSSSPSMPSHDVPTSASAALGTSLMASSSRISKDSYPRTLSSIEDEDLKSTPASPKRRSVLGRLGLSSK